MKTRIFTYLFAAALAAALSHSPAWAQLRPGGAGDSGGPVAISSDRMEADDPQGLVRFIGDVVARQGDMTMTCDRMDVYYMAQEQPAESETPATDVAASAEGKTAASPFSSSSRQIDRVECRGNVLVLEGERQASGETALYLAQALPRRIVLTGNARVWQGQDSLTGHQVTYYLDSDRSLVESGRGGRVRTIFNQEDGGK